SGRPTVPERSKRAALGGGQRNWHQKGRSRQDLQHVYPIQTGGPQVRRFWCGPGGLPIHRPETQRRNLPGKRAEGRQPLPRQLSKGLGRRERLKGHWTYVRTTERRSSTL